MCRSRIIRTQESCKRISQKGPSESLASGLREDKQDGAKVNSASEGLTMNLHKRYLVTLYTRHR